MPNRQADPEAAPINLLVMQERGEFVIQIPPTWKVTFGAVNPGSQMSGRDLHCLRVYEGEKLRGVYCDVRGFRDLSIPLMRKVHKETGSAEWTQDSEGNFERNEKVIAERSWAPPENPGDIPF